MPPSTIAVLRKTFSLYEANWALFLKYTLVMVLSIAITSISQSFFRASYEQTGVLPPLPILAGEVLIILLLSGITLWGTITLIRVIWNKYAGKPVDSFFKEMFLSFPLIPSFLWVIILFGLSAVGGLLLLIIPAFIFSLWFFFSSYARIIDNKKGTEALRFSKNLVKKDWATVLWVIISLTVLIFGSLELTQLVVDFVFTFLYGVTTSPVIAVFGFVFNLLTNIAFAPVYIIAITILYSELKSLQTT